MQCIDQVSRQSNLPRQVLAKLPKPLLAIELTTRGNSLKKVSATVCLRLAAVFRRLTGQGRISYS